MQDDIQYECPDCGSREWYSYTEKCEKSSLQKTKEWILCLFQNMFNALGGGEKKQMPIFLEKQWICKNCGAKHADFDEVADKLQSLKRVELLSTGVWVIYIISVAFVCVYSFYIFLLLQLLGFGIAYIVKNGIRETANPLIHALRKTE